MYAHVENNEVTRMGALPKNWRNISGLNKSEGDIPYLKTLGWLPLVEVDVILGANETRDDDVVEIAVDAVTVTHTKRTMTSQEITDRDDGLWFELREKRDELLKDSDSRFLADAPSSRGSQAWKDYRQALRDLPANTVNPKNPTWPTKPE